MGELRQSPMGPDLTGAHNTQYSCVSPQLLLSIRDGRESEGQAQIYRHIRAYIMTTNLLDQPVFRERGKVTYMGIKEHKCINKSALPTRHDINSLLVRLTG